MKCDPKTDQELAKLEEENLISKGIYDFEVHSAKDTFSKKGNDMTELVLTVLDNEGVERKVFDYLVSVDAFAFKIKHFAQATGLETQYQSGDLPADLMLGRTGKCKLDIQPAKNGYRAKNVVADYIKTGDAQAAEIAKRPAVQLDDEIPF